MPYKNEKIKIDCPFLDSRKKLLPCQKEMIIYWHVHFNTSSRKLAAMFSVSRRSIQFILDPQKLIDNKESRRLRGGSNIYYQKDKFTKAMKKHRDYKNAIGL